METEDRCLTNCIVGWSEEDGNLIYQGEYYKFISGNCVVFDYCPCCGSELINGRTKEDFRNGNTDV